MTELLTARDVELKTFKKVSFGGYAVQEVEEFLNQVADDLEAYVLRIDERDNRIHELEEYVRKQESMTDMIKNALIQAQKAAQDMEEEANTRRENILADANVQADKKIADANSQANDIMIKARGEAAKLVKEAQDLKLETEKRWESLEHELALRKQEVTDETDRMLDAAQADADRMLDDAARQVDDYNNKLRLLNLQKQQFLRETASLLINFGRIIDKAQQDVENELNIDNNNLNNLNNDDLENNNNNYKSSDTMERFQHNFLEGGIDESAGNNEADAG